MNPTRLPIGVARAGAAVPQTCRRAISLLVLVALLLAGCSGGDSQPVDGASGNAVDAATEPTGGPIADAPAGQGGDIDMPVTDVSVDEPFLPGSTDLSRLLPDRTMVFGEPIETFPDPDLVSGNGYLYWDYTLVGDQLESARYEAPLSHRRLWQRFAELIPAELRPSMKTVGFEIPPTGEIAWARAVVGSYGYTDVPGGAITSLGLSEALVTETLASIDAGYGSSAFDRVAVHEFAHVLQAQDGVVVDTTDPAFIGWFGVSHRRTGPIGRFLSTFWEGETTRVWLEYQQSAEPAVHVHEAFPDAFVSVYAATNPFEDFAESFEMFVNEAGVLESGGLPGADKLRMLWDWPDAVVMRDQLRSLR